MAERVRKPENTEEVFNLFLRRRVTLSPLRYPGGKRRLVPYVAALLAENQIAPDVFVEPYAGGASVSLELLYFGLVGRVVLADADPMITAFWQTVVEDVDWLCKQVEEVPLNLQTWDRMKHGRFRSRRSLALACLYLNRTSFNGALHPSAGPIGGYAQASKYAIGCRFPRKRLVKRLRECAAMSDRITVVAARDAMTTLREQRDAARRAGEQAFFYLDPPFWAKSDRLYRRSFNPVDHERLADALQWVRDPFLLSYDPAIEIAELYQAHSAESVAQIELFYTAAGKSAGTEIVISNLPKLPNATQLWRPHGEWGALRKRARRALAAAEGTS